MTAGDIVIIPHGDTHLLGNGAPEKPVDSFGTFSNDVSQGLKLVRFGGGGEITKFVCGYLSCEPRLSEVFLAGLPRVLVVHVAKEASGQWLEHSIRFAVEAVNGSHAGSGLMLAKLSELLFVETLRRYISTLPPSETGWLPGARDSVTGQALCLLHREPAYPWTISTLARRVGLSRTRLAERFRHFLGRAADGLLGPMAAQTGRGDFVVDRGQRSAGRGGGGLWLRSGIQPRLQAGIWLASGAIPSQAHVCFGPAFSTLRPWRLIRKRVHHRPGTFLVSANAVGAVKLHPAWIRFLGVAAGLTVLFL